MKIKNILFPLLVGSAGFVFPGCTDDFEEVNTNPNKVYNVNLEDVWSGTVKRSMDVFAELNYNRLLNFSRSVVVQFNTNPGQDTGDAYFRKFYVEILRDLVKLERQYGNDPATYANRLAIIKTWKSYCFYMMASMWGPIPMSDAISDGSENKRYYKYDSEIEIYTAILKDLTDAYTMLENANSTAAVAMEMDPVYGADGNGQPDMQKWKRFCNSLRLNVAMHIQNLDRELSREYALKAMQGDLMTSNSDNAILRYGTMLENSSSYYYTRFIYNQTSFNKSVYPAVGEYFYIYLKSFDDPRMPKFIHKSNELAVGNEKAYVFTDTITRPHQCFNRDNTNQGYRKCPDYAEHQADKLNAFRRDSIIVEYMAEYVPLNELNNLPSGWEWGIIPTDPNNNRYFDPLDRFNSQYNPSFVQDNFVNEQAQMPILTYADVCFLKAEAAMLYLADEGSAKSYYEEGIMASMAQYGVTDYNAYLSHDGVKWGTSYKGYHDRRMLYQAQINGENGSEGKLEQIYKQRYIADFFMGLEEWNLERRTRALDFPPFFMSGGSSNIEGVNSTYNYWTERLIYPEAEISKNSTAYYEGIAKLQASSPFYRSERWGDNVFSSLGFAKLNPQLESAPTKWGGHHVIYPQLEYMKHCWGKTYEEVLESARAYSGQTVASVALGKISYKWTSTYSVYETEDMPPHDDITE